LPNQHFFFESPSQNHCGFFWDVFSGISPPTFPRDSCDLPVFRCLGRHLFFIVLSPRRFYLLPTGETVSDYLKTSLSFLCGTLFPLFNLPRRAFPSHPVFVSSNDHLGLAPLWFPHHQTPTHPPKKKKGNQGTPHP